jgi:hypothetical protein
MAIPTKFDDDVVRFTANMKVTEVIGGEGGDGRGIVSIDLTSSEGLVDTYTITYTDNTTSTFTVTNGKDGVDGKTPEKGVDYWTPEDKAEIVDEVLEALPMAEGVEF